MEVTHKTIEQAQLDKQTYENYLKHMKEESPMFIRKSFKEMFGYEIILFENGGFELHGERFY